MTSYWLMKSEPDVFSIDDLQQVMIEPWNGIRNYQARNFLRTMQVGDLAFFYHSNTKVAGIVGIMQIVKTAYPDPSQFYPESQYFDPKSNVENPRWDMVDVQFVEKWAGTLSLNTLKTMPELDNSPLTRQGNRLSIIPMSHTEWQAILHQAKSQGII